MSAPLVSVIMAAYRAERTVEEAIESVLAQRGVAFELLIGEDASPDRTWERIRRYREDPRVRAWRFRPRKGCAFVRNRLIARARGRYLSICDADDLLLPGNLARLSDILDKRPGAGAAYGALKRIDQRGRPLRRRPEFPGPLRQWDLLWNTVSHPGTMIRRSAFRAVGGYRPSYQVMSDYDFFLRLAERRQIHWARGLVLSAYRKHGGSLSRTTPKTFMDRTRRRVLAEAIARRYGYSVSWSGARRRAAGIGRPAVEQ